MNIKTSRLTIKAFSLDMAQSVYENSKDDDTRRFVPDEVYDSAEEARAAIEFLMSRYDSDDGPFVYPIITNDGKNIGYVQLCQIDYGSWEIGYHIAKQFTGQGFATEAVKAFLPVMPKNTISKKFTESALRKIQPLCASWKNAGLYRSFRAMENIKEKMLRL